MLEQDTYDFYVGLSVECVGGHGHLPLEGSHKGVHRSKMAENYPEDLAQQLAYLGHPAPDVLSHMTEIQSTEAVLKAAKEYECVHCHERKSPSGVPPVAMTMMDQATRYVALRIVKDEKSATLVKGIEKGWIKRCGTPRYLRIDEAKGFAATYLRDWCSERGIMLGIAPAESHNWLGSVERKHQVVRKALELYMAERMT